MSENFSNRRHMLLLAGSIAAASWILPLLSGLCVPLYILSLPVRYLNTHVHEFFHAITALGSGGSVNHIQVFGHGGGVTFTDGGSAFLIGSAGYLGSAILGAALAAMSSTDKGARRALFVVAILLALSLALWVRGDLSGVLWALGWMSVLFLAGGFLRGAAAHFTGQLLGMLLCLSSAQSLFDLLGFSATTTEHSDARVLEAVTGVPALAWAIIWLGFGVAVMAIAIRAVWRQEES